MTSPAATHGSFTIERHFDAKPERVYAALSDIEAKSRWFSGPPGWVLHERTLDCRVGGTETLMGEWADGKKTRFSARYEEIIPGQRMVYTYHMHIGDWHISISLATVEISPDGDGTMMVFTEQATFINGFEDPNAEGRKTGSGHLFDRLAASLQD